MRKKSIIFCDGFKGDIRSGYTIVKEDREIGDIYQQKSLLQNPVYSYFRLIIIMST